MMLMEVKVEGQQSRANEAIHDAAYSLKARLPLVRHIHLFLAETSEAFFSLGWRFSSRRHFASDFAILGQAFQK
jgi:hypothetical protein